MGAFESITSLPFEMISHGGSGVASGFLLLAVELLILLVVILAGRRIAMFAGTEKLRVKGRVKRKFVIPKHREWQGKAYVTVPDKDVLEIDVENRPCQYSPAPWKYQRVSEGDDIDVAIQKARFGNQIRILDIGPF